MIKVVVGIIEKDGKVLIARRVTDDPLKGRWEFPGGKVEKNESPRNALKRELQEELGITADIGKCISCSTYDYGHILIELSAYSVSRVSGDIQSDEYQNIIWVDRKDLGELDFPEANKPIINTLQRESRR